MDSAHGQPDRGTAIIVMPAKDNLELAFVNVRVHPDSRRPGMGTRLLAQLLPELTAAGRTIAVEAM